MVSVVLTQNILAPMADVYRKREESLKFDIPLENQAIFPYCHAIFTVLKILCSKNMYRNLAQQLEQSANWDAVSEIDKSYPYAPEDAKKIPAHVMAFSQDLIIDSDNWTEVIWKDKCQEVKMSNRKLATWESEMNLKHNTSPTSPMPIIFEPGIDIIPHHNDDDKIELPEGDLSFSQSDIDPDTIDFRKNEIMEE